jgi:hypothetical protein
MTELGGATTEKVRVALREGLRRGDGLASEPSSLSSMMTSDDTGTLEEFPRDTGRLGRRDGCSSSNSSTSMISWWVRRLGMAEVEAPSTVTGISLSISSMKKEQRRRRCRECQRLS